MNSSRIRIERYKGWIKAHFEQEKIKCAACKQEHEQTLKRSQLEYQVQYVLINRLMDALRLAADERTRVLEALEQEIKFVCHKAGVV